MPFTLTEASADPLLTENLPDQGNRWTLNFGPQHPATHTTLRLVLELVNASFGVPLISGIYIPVLKSSANT